jgi:hypothetical protein
MAAVHPTHSGFSGKEVFWVDKERLGSEMALSEVGMFIAEEA